MTTDDRAAALADVLAEVGFDFWTETGNEDPRDGMREMTFDYDALARALAARGVALAGEPSGEVERLRNALAALTEAVQGSVGPGDPAYDALWHPMAEADRVLANTAEAAEREKAAIRAQERKRVFHHLRRAWVSSPPNADSEDVAMAAMIDRAEALLDTRGRPMTTDDRAAAVLAEALRGLPYDLTNRDMAEATLAALPDTIRPAVIAALAGEPSGEVVETEEIANDLYIRVVQPDTIWWNDLTPEMQEGWLRAARYVQRVLAAAAQRHDAAVIECRACDHDEVDALATAKLAALRQHVTENFAQRQKGLRGEDIIVHGSVEHRDTDEARQTCRTCSILANTADAAQRPVPPAPDHDLIDIAREGRQPQWENPQRHIRALLEGTDQ
ncbi:MAG TPA: hypothetical protein VM305_08270 [Candidatus Limnocylindrales bacterium]|nr:hypothetical protein [Candidatus Limnocylindrales bacterium]